MQDINSVDNVSIESDGLAKYLLKENLLLTALEYHYELLERGKMVECLKDFFENPSNFDTFENFQPPEAPLKSCVSVSTLDSMDLHADTEDTSAIQNQVKATNTNEAPNKDEMGQTAVPAMALEKRTIRFLINEHLLSSGYKLTAVQFAEECEVDEQQDLDDWADTDTSFQDLRQELEAAHRNLSMMQCSQGALKAELEVSHQQVDDLRGKISRLESENLSLSQESTYWRNQLLCLKRKVPTEFLHCATQMLPSPENSSVDVVTTSFRLADSVDEIIIIVGRQIESILSALPENSKAVSHPH
ncbi:unnamed protein product [Dibothriocephalus latus]|uniref:Uncharacterized protein n=1 Tax=Dibothriocephalus latus TaxID=60516 RepID=A0A3P6TA27_DIBLA|nr:unnamed protein product [Dibothriocephalus latus]